MLADSATGKTLTDCLYEAFFDVVTVTGVTGSSSPECEGKTIYYILKYILRKKHLGRSLKGLDAVMRHLNIDPAGWGEDSANGDSCIGGRNVAAKKLRLLYGNTEVKSRSQFSEIIDVYLARHAEGTATPPGSTGGSTPKNSPKSSSSSPKSRTCISSSSRSSLRAKEKTAKTLVPAWQRLYDTLGKDNLLMLYTFGEDAPKVCQETLSFPEQPDEHQTFLSTDPERVQSDRLRFKGHYKIIV